MPRISSSSMSRLLVQDGDGVAFLDGLPFGHLDLYHLAGARRLGALENFIDIHGGMSVQVVNVCPIRQETASLDYLTVTDHRGQTVFQCELCEFRSCRGEHSVVELDE